MNSRLSSVLLLCTFLLILIFGCSSNYNNFAVVHESSHYMNLNDKTSWETINEIVSAGKILPVELIDGNLVVLKKEYQKQQRSFDNLNYVGVIFEFDRNTSLNSDTLLSLRKNNDLLKQLVDTRINMSKQTNINNGMVLYLNSYDALTDEQAEVIAASPAKCVMLENLPYLSVKQSRILSSFKGKTICLNGLLWIGKGHAMALCQFEGDYLSLNKIRTLSREQAKALCGFKGEKLFLQGLYKESKEIVYQYQNESIASIIMDEE